MNLLEYYINQQKFKEWYEKFQSTAKHKSGKVFSHTSTTYRGITNFLGDLYKFKNNNGIPRTEWEKYEENGQDKDKQRTLPLSNAEIINKDVDKYYLTNIGYTCMDLIDLDCKDVDKWLLLFIILLNYKFEERKNDILLTTREEFEYFQDAGLDENEIIRELKDLRKCQTLEDIFHTDIFWYITFAKDQQFIMKYQNSSMEEKRELADYVTKEQKKEKSKDLIGHKYTSSGQMLKSTFLEEAEILYYSKLLLKNKYRNLTEFIDFIIGIYTEIHINANKEIIITFIKNHKSVYDYIFNHTGLRREEDGE